MHNYELLIHAYKLACISTAVCACSHICITTYLIPTLLTAGTLVAEQLKNNTILTRLNLRECGLTSQSATSLAEALITNTHLEELNISGNLLNDDAIQHLAHALQVNQHLKRLELAGCGITDVGLEYLAKSIENNRILNSLNVSITLDSEKDNLITEKIIPILIKNLKNNQALTNLSLPLMGYLQIEEAINDVRQRSPGLPLLKVEGMYTYNFILRNVQAHIYLVQPIYLAVLVLSSDTFSS